jgi:hypothetical protein
MSYRIRLRRLVAALTIAVAVCTVPASMLSTRAHAAARRSSVRSTMCDIPWQKGPLQVRHLIRCSARRWRVSGGPDKAVRVARCESRFRPKARNPAGYSGIFQQSTKYWRHRAKAFGFPRWSVYNGRANVMVSIRMAHRWGWGGWSCA